MKKNDIIKIACEHFNSLEDEIIAKYERDLNDPSWSSTDAYCYTPPASPIYANVEGDDIDTTIKYREYCVFVRDMPSVNIHHVKFTFDDEVVRSEYRDEVERKLARVTTVYHGECSADFLNLSTDDIVRMIKESEKRKKVVELHIIEGKWYNREK